MTADNTRILALADAYARTAAERETASRELVAWAFADAHTEFVTARADLDAALGIPADALPPLADATTALAEALHAREVTA
ncbi:hypothetical protein [Agromyces aerolatus]|uniref:hypothetical protein n=1 Tax=Agromyces sp. LY-1074 TaxID=3074080 RepID=UPI002860D29A|nr:MULTISPECIES: hypothetical protein [unclassified Agromyces]MDR5699851.1 hypothetical protein [Agromyces sp. LY-1074]MDR5706337.1 hypothetical protein [Agromyces sp. LY-1358]